MVNIVLFGFKSCGKSSTGKLLAKKLHRTFVDVDRVIEDLYFNPLLGRHKTLSCVEIFRQHGEEFFRALERDAIRKIRLVKQGVVATGGGAVADYYNHIELKKNGLLVYLKASKQILKQRLFSMTPLPAILDPLDPEGSFEELYEERVAIYERIADIVVETGSRSIEEVADEVRSLSHEF